MINPVIEQYIVSHYYELLRIAQNITKNHQLTNDLVQDVILQLYERGEIELRDYEQDTIKYYITAVMRINWYSKTSPFYKRIKKNNNVEFTDMSIPDEVYNTEEDILIKSVEEKFGEMNWYDKELLTLYILCGNIRDVATIKKMGKSTVARKINSIKAKYL